MFETNFINSIKSDLQSNGYSLFNNREHTYKENAVFDYQEFSRNFGNVMGQYGGELEVIIKPYAEYENVYYSQNRRELYPHTEAYEFDNPPRYIILQCINPDKFGLGFTPICCMRNFLNSLDKRDLLLLNERSYQFSANSGLSLVNKVKVTVKPIFEQSDNRSLFRFSYNNMKVDEEDYFAKKILNSVMDYFYTHQEKLLLKKDDVLILDNHITLHARTSFKDMNRQIRRIWIE